MIKITHDKAKVIVTTSDSFTNQQVTHNLSVDEWRTLVNVGSVHVSAAERYVNASYDQIPAATMQSLEAYKKNHEQVSSFVYAVLTNDLKSAFAVADSHNLAALPIVLEWCKSELPYGCWGSVDAVSSWAQ